MTNSQIEAVRGVIYEAPEGRYIHGEHYDALPADVRTAVEAICKPYFFVPAQADSYLWSLDHETELLNVLGYS